MHISLIITFALSESSNMPSFYVRSMHDVVNIVKKDKVTKRPLTFSCRQQ